MAQLKDTEINGSLSLTDPNGGGVKLRMSIQNYKS